MKPFTLLYFLHAQLGFLKKKKKKKKQPWCNANTYEWCMIDDPLKAAREKITSFPHLRTLLEDLLSSKLRKLC